jgi:hypothetical protein
MTYDMTCICCGEEAECVRDNISYVDANKKDFGLVIPYVSVWLCKKCDKGWAYQDGVLSMVGKAWHTMDATKIPDGALAVLKEEPS